MQTFTQAQQQLVQVRALLGKIAQNCFKVCVDGKPCTHLSNSEQSCMVSRSLSVSCMLKLVPAIAQCYCSAVLSNCTVRFMDATKFVGAKATAELQPKNDNAYE